MLRSSEQRRDSEGSGSVEALLNSAAREEEVRGVSHESRTSAALCLRHVET